MGGLPKLCVAMHNAHNVSMKMTLCVSAVYILTFKPTPKSQLICYNFMFIEIFLEFRHNSNELSPLAVAPK